MRHPYLALFGPPGVGKGTQAQLLAQRRQIPHISTGDIFRTHLKEMTPLGHRAAVFLNAGKLVPDEVVIAVVENRLNHADVRMGFLLDGFPRTVPQAEALKRILMEHLLGPLHIINLLAADEVLLDRISGRRTCGRCKAVYHIRNNPPRHATICDQCGNSLTQREDDKVDVVRERLRIYHEQTAPVLTYYQKQNTVHDVDGTGAVDAVNAAVNKIVDRLLQSEAKLGN